MKNLEEQSMSKAGITIFLFCFAAAQFFCSSSRVLNIEKSKPGESVQILLKDGTERQGIVIAREDTILKYVDAATHNLTPLAVDKILSLQRSLQVFDLEGDRISEEQIHAAKGWGKTVGYSFAGVALGAAVGFGVGVIIASGSDVPIAYSMAALGIAGGITLGILGNRSDRDDAIDKVRQERLNAAKDQMREQLLKEEKLLEEQKKEKEKMIKELDQKKK
jgi:hypothetical protein